MEYRVLVMGPIVKGALIRLRKEWLACLCFMIACMLIRYLSDFLVQNILFNLVPRSLKATGYIFPVINFISINLLYLFYILIAAILAKCLYSGSSQARQDTPLQIWQYMRSFTGRMLMLLLLFYSLFLTISIVTSKALDAAFPHQMSPDEIMFSGIILIILVFAISISPILRLSLSPISHVTNSPIPFLKAWKKTRGEGAALTGALLILMLPYTLFLIITFAAIGELHTMPMLAKTIRIPLDMAHEVLTYFNLAIFLAVGTEALALIQEEPETQ